MTMTKEQYLTLRKSGKKRNDVQKEHFGNDSIAFKNFLSMIGLLSLETELIALRDFQPTKSIKPKEPFEPTKQEVEKEMSPSGRTPMFPHVTKEFIKAAFAAGKSAGQIEREEGMQQGTIYGRIKKWGIVNPNTKVASVQEKAEAVAEEVEELIDCDYEVVDDVIEKSEEVEAETCEVEEPPKTLPEAKPTKFIYFQIPIIEGYKIVDDGMERLFNAIFSTTVKNIDLVRSAEELFFMIQRYTQLVHHQIETLIVNGDPMDHVQNFIHKHNLIHIENLSESKQ